MSDNAYCNARVSISTRVSPSLDPVVSVASRASSFSLTLSSNTVLLPRPPELYVWVFCFLFLLGSFALGSSSPSTASDWASCRTSFYSLSRNGYGEKHPFSMCLYYAIVLWEPAKQQVWHMPLRACKSSHEYWVTPNTLKHPRSRSAAGVAHATPRNRYLRGA